MQIGYISYVVGETITPAIKEGDLLIVASASGETNSVCQAVKSAQKENVKVITITANEQSTLYKLQQALITIKVSTKYITIGEYTDKFNLNEEIPAGKKAKGFTYCKKINSLSELKEVSGIVVISKNNDDINETKEYNFNID